MSHLYPSAPLVKPEKDDRSPRLSKPSDPTNRWERPATADSEKARNGTPAKPTLLPTAHARGMQDKLSSGSNATRPAFRCKVQYKGRTIEAEVSDIDDRGAFVPTDEVVAPGSVVTLCLSHPGAQDIVAHGRVRWPGIQPMPTVGSAGFVVRFERIDEGSSTLQSLGEQRAKLLRTMEFGRDRIMPLLLLPECTLTRARAWIANYRLSPVLESMAAAFERVGMSHRNMFLWKSTRVGMECEMLPSVSPELASMVNDVKTLGAMVDVLLDDLADEQRDRVRLEKLISLLQPRLTGEGAPPAKTHDPYLDFTSFLWDEMWHMIERLPRYKEFSRILRFDWHQVINSMRFSLLVNEIPELQNTAEHDAYVPHNMHIMCNASLDLMCSPGVPLRELGVVRKVALLAQQMGRIGNMVTTWERELKSRDFTSGMWPHALERGVLSMEELTKDPPRLLTERLRKSGLEAQFLLRWEQCRAELLSLQEAGCSMNLTTFAQGLDELLAIQLASRGLC